MTGSPVLGRDREERRDLGGVEPGRATNAGRTAVDGQRLVVAVVVADGVAGEDRRSAGRRRRAASRTVIGDGRGRRASCIGTRVGRRPARRRSGSATMRRWISPPPAVCSEWRPSTRVARGPGELSAPDPSPPSGHRSRSRRLRAAHARRPRRSPRRSPWWCAPGAGPSRGGPRRGARRSARRPPDDVPGTYDRAGDPIGASLRHPVVALDDTRTVLLDANPWRRSSPSTRCSRCSGRCPTSTG